MSFSRIGFVVVIGSCSFSKQLSTYFGILGLYSKLTNGSCHRVKKIKGYLAFLERLRARRNHIIQNDHIDIPRYPTIHRRSRFRAAMNGRHLLKQLLHGRHYTVPHFPNTATCSICSPGSSRNPSTIVKMSNFSLEKISLFPTVPVIDSEMTKVTWWCLAIFLASSSRAIMCPYAGMGTMRTCFRLSVILENQKRLNVPTS